MEGSGLQRVWFGGRGGVGFGDGGSVGRGGGGL